MNIVDIAIVLMLVLSAVLGFRTGLIRSVASLLGLIVGIAIASWNYARLAEQFTPGWHSRATADALWFCVIAIVVMIVAGLVGLLLQKVVHGVGLGWLDRILGLFFGFLRGAALATLCVTVLVAFFPETLWLGSAQLPHYLLNSLNLTVQAAPGEFQQKISDGLEKLEQQSARWLREK
ncbi:MAG TPA: CvpA family protein [Acidobacteriaceae bacterium]